MTSLTSLLANANSFNKIISVAHCDIIEKSDDV